VTKFVVRGEAPPEDPPTEFWLEEDDDGDVRLYAGKAGTSNDDGTLLGYIGVANRALRLMHLGERDLAELGLASEDEHLKVVR